MIICFELSMPSNNSWNGRWGGEGVLYAVVRSFRKMPEINGKQLAGSRFTYSFGDGWVAAIVARELTSAAAAKIRRESKGFLGYDWMIDSILQYGKILVDPPTQAKANS